MMGLNSLLGGERKFRCGKDPTLGMKVVTQSCSERSISFHTNVSCDDTGVARTQLNWTPVTSPTRSLVTVPRLLIFRNLP